MFDNDNAISYTENDIVKLDNCIDKCNGENMRYSEVYTYMNRDGVKEKIRLFGPDKDATDYKFQMFLLHVNDAPTLTLEEFVNSVYYKGFLPKKASAVTSYKFFLSKYILPNLGKKLLTDITVFDIQNLLDWMANGSKHGLKKDIAEGTISRVKGLISHIFNIAVDMKYVEDNPVKSTLLKNNGAESEHHEALSDEDIATVKSKIPKLKKETDRVCIGIIAYTGMRPEEVRGLVWEDIHLEQQYIDVRRAVTYVGSDRHANIDTPKTKKSIRTVYMPKPLCDILTAVKEKEGYLVHGRDSSKPIACASWSKMIGRIFKELGIKGKYVPYDFRATYATQFKESGMSSALVADLMGHADTRMVETIYARTRHQSIMKQADKIEELNRMYVH